MNLVNPLQIQLHELLQQQRQERGRTEEAHHRMERQLQARTSELELLKSEMLRVQESHREELSRAQADAKRAATAAQMNVYKEEDFLKLQDEGGWICFPSCDSTGNGVWCFSLENPCILRSGRSSAPLLISSRATPGATKGP